MYYISIFLTETPKNLHGVMLVRWHYYEVLADTQTIYFNLFKSSNFAARHFELKWMEELALHKRNAYRVVETRFNFARSGERAHPNFQALFTPRLAISPLRPH